MLCTGQVCLFTSCSSPPYSGIYLAYELNRMYLAKDANDPMMADGLLASIEIYLGIINMFLSFLQLLGGSGD